MSIARSLMLIALTGIAALASLAGCRATDASADGRVQLVKSGATFPQDAARIQSARISNDTLHLRVAHGGGLQPHDFSLYAFEFMESNPVRVTVVLSHDAKGDMGEALLTKDLSFDLSPLKSAHRMAYGYVGPMILLLHEPGDGTKRTSQVRYKP